MTADEIRALVRDEVARQIAEHLQPRPTRPQLAPFSGLDVASRGYVGTLAELGRSAEVLGELERQRVLLTPDGLEPKARDRLVRVLVERGGADSPHLSTEWQPLITAARAEYDAERAKAAANEEQSKRRGEQFEAQRRREHDELEAQFARDRGESPKGAA